MAAITCHKRVFYHIEMSVSVAKIFAQWAADINKSELPESVRASARRSFLDVVGFCLAVRNADYVNAAISAWGGNGDCSVHWRRV